MNDDIETLRKALVAMQKGVDWRKRVDADYALDRIEAELARVIEVADEFQAEVERLRERDAVTQEMWEKTLDENERLRVELFRSRAANQGMYAEENKRLLNELKLTQEELMREQTENERLQALVDDPVDETMYAEVERLRRNQCDCPEGPRAALAEEKA